MNNILIANILAFIAQMISIYMSTRNNKGKILSVQIVSMVLLSLSSFLLKGYSAVVIDALAIVRNIVVLKQIQNRYLDLSFVILTVVLGVAFNNRGFIGLLPIVANVLQTIVLTRKDMKIFHIKIAFGMSFVCWCIFNFAIQSYVGAVFGLINMVVNFYEAFKNRSV